MSDRPQSKYGRLLATWRNATQDLKDAEATATLEHADLEPGLRVAKIHLATKRERAKANEAAQALDEHSAAMREEELSYLRMIGNSHALAAAYGGVRPASEWREGS